jgi:hypothetical protein
MAVSVFFIINQQKPPTVLLKDNWPFLLTLDGLFNHFEKLMGFSLVEKTDAFLGGQALTLFNFAKSKEDGNLKTMVKKLSRTSKLIGNEIPKTVGCFLLIPLLLKETENQLFRCYDVSELYPEIFH